MHPKVVCLFLLAMLMTSTGCVRTSRQKPFEATLLDYQGKPRPRRPELKKGSRTHDVITMGAKTKVVRGLVAILREKANEKQNLNDPMRKLLNAQLRWDTSYVDKPERVTYFAIWGLVCSPYCLGFIVAGTHNQKNVAKIETHGELHHPDKSDKSRFGMLTLRKGRDYENSPADPVELGEFLKFLEVAKTQNLEKLLFPPSIAPIKAPAEAIANHAALQVAVGLEEDPWNTFGTFCSLVATTASVLAINHDLPYTKQPDFPIDELCRQVADALSYFDDTHFLNFWPIREALRMYLEDYQAERKIASGTEPQRSGHKKNRRFSPQHSDGT
ncbi:hypothetical protein BDP27DRAFT_1376741 [Rhodocollybia butyracea]|uniref:Uncharacterized protein n=1 Tax=Rhodocollybia butyracea TaxID=206335 RepID=A0A9P5P506_9AGAR|nr:hypothetical protein BDP27DRAFT_1376741 [Rhodocollybia butyracea]